MKNKYIAALLSLFFGIFGLHKFYLGDIKGGIFRILLFLALSMFVEDWVFVLWLYSLMESVLFLTMSTEKFNQKYNEPNLHESRPWGRQPVAGTPFIKDNPYIKTGNEKYKDYDYTGAIEEYTKGLALSPNDKVLHFNMACAYSLTEDADKSMYHLSKAIENGYNDFDTLRTKDDLAFLRVQPEFQELVNNNFRYTRPQERTEPATRPKQEVQEMPDLLEQIKLLNQRRERGELTDDEYFIERKKILG